MSENTSRRPHIVLLHSLGANSESWRLVAEALEPTCDLSAPDFPGHGSEPLTAELSLTSLAHTIHEKFLVHRESPSHIVGVSMGGLVAAVLAARYPQDVESIVIADSFAALPPEVVRQRLDSIEQDTAELGMERYARQYADATLRADVDHGTRQLLVNAVAGMSRGTYREAARMCFEADVRGYLQSIRQPSVVMVGALDERTPRGRAEEIAAELRHNEVLVIPGSGHLPNLDQPAEFARAIYEAVTSGPSRS